MGMGTCSGSVTRHTAVGGSSSESRDAHVDRRVARGVGVDLVQAVEAKSPVDEEL